MTCFRKDKMTLRKWCVENGVNYNTVYYWLEKGLNVDKAIEKTKSQKPLGRPIKYKYKDRSLADYCKEVGIGYGYIYQFIKKGYSVEEAVNEATTVDKRLDNKGEHLIFDIGDMVEFWLPNKIYRYGKLVRKSGKTCIIVSNMLKNRRIYKIDENNLNYFRGEDYVRNKGR